MFYLFQINQRNRKEIPNSKTHQSLVIIFQNLVKSMTKTRFLSSVTVMLCQG